MLLMEYGAGFAMIRDTMEERVMITIASSRVIIGMTFGFMMISTAVLKMKNDAFWANIKVNRAQLLFTLGATTVIRLFVMKTAISVCVMMFGTVEVAHIWFEAAFLMTIALLEITWAAFFIKVWRPFKLNLLDRKGLICTHTSW